MVNERTNDNLDQQLSQLIVEACSFPSKSFERRQRLTQVVQLVQHSGKLWYENTPFYEEVLQKTWLHVCRNPEAYDSSRAGVITWINNYLRFRLKDKRRDLWQEQQHRVSTNINLEDDLIELLPASQPIPPILEETLQWIEQDSDGELRGAHLRGCPEINCQILLQRRFPPEVSWEAIAEEFNLKSTAGITALYHRKCLPILRQFGQQQGYLENDQKTGK